METNDDRLKLLERRLARTEGLLRATWTFALLGAVAAFALGAHPEARAQLGVTLAELDGRLKQVEAKTQDMERTVDPLTGQNTVRFAGVNVQVVSGTGDAAGAVNGAGNLIVGYNASRNAPGYGTGNDIRTGSHNLIVGDYHNYSSFGGLVAGVFNTNEAEYGSVSGGGSNTVVGYASSVTGGSRNIASGIHTSISGGSRSTASGPYSSVSGGFGATVSGPYTSASGGIEVTASGPYAAVSGGTNNTASGPLSSVSGGGHNTASGNESWAGAGGGNSAAGYRSSISGGQRNVAGGSFASVSGGLEHNVVDDHGWRGGGTTPQP